MIAWLASYPRSGNTFFRILLKHTFGFHTRSVYSSAAHPVGSSAVQDELYPEQIQSLARLIGEPEEECDVGALQSDSEIHLVKTHELPEGDNFPGVTLIRDGRDAVVSYAHFVLKTEQGIGRPSRDLFEDTLGEIITGDRFGGWSGNVNGWIDRVGWERVVRYEDLIKDPVAIVAAALRRLSIDSGIGGGAPPSFHELHATVPWFFRKGKVGSWRQEMPLKLQELFLERHGDTLRRLGYPTSSPDSVSAPCVAIR